VAGGPFNATQSATVSEPIAAGAILTTTINGTDIPYTVTATDTAASIASSIAAAITASTALDPSTGLALNKLVTATSSGGVLTVTAQSFTTPLTLSITSSI